MTIACMLPVPLEQPQRLLLSATIDECATIAKQFRVPAISRMEARVQLQQHKACLHCSGKIFADWQDRCVVSNQPISLTLEETINLRLYWDIDEETLAPEDDLVERDAAGKIDLGSLLIEYVSLNMPDYPRHPDSALPEQLIAESPPEGKKTRPFADLQALLGNRGASGPKSD